MADLYRAWNRWVSTIGNHFNFKVSGCQLTARGLTCFTSGFTRTVYCHFDGFRVSRYQGRRGADCDGQCEAFACK